MGVPPREARGYPGLAASPRPLIRFTQATSTSTEQYGRSQDEKARSNQQANAAVWTRGSESESDTTDTWIGPAVPLPKMFYDVLVRARVVLHGCGAALGWCVGYATVMLRQAGC